MGAANPVDPANVVQALVYTLLDVFDATRDLYQTLRDKDKRDYENSLRSRGYPSGRKIDFVDDADGEESIIMDKAAVTRQFEIGSQDIGSLFAVGDVITQTAVQAQIITLQSVIITIFLYGPSSPKPISHHLGSLVAASRAAGTTTVDILGAQRQRQLAPLPPTPRTPQSPVTAVDAQPLPYLQTTVPSTSFATAALIKSRQDVDNTPTRIYPANTTTLSRPSIPRSDTESTSFSGPTSYGTESTPCNLFCLYALDLQQHPAQPLSASITSDPIPYCPHCKRTLHLSPGKSWEVYKDDGGVQRCFRVQNRFVVKCHRNSVDGGYSCVLCSQGSSVAVCGDVRALIKHVWMDHSAAELETDDDVLEVFERTYEQKRDSWLGYGSRRSVSLGPSKGRGPGRVERSVETLEIRAPRREP